MLKNYLKVAIRNLINSEQTPNDWMMFIYQSAYVFRQGIGRHPDEVTETIQNSPLNELVLVSRETFRKMEEDRQTLYALHEAGVDNWSGYSYAMELLDEHNK